jgi:uncharacterized integral membrane protein
MPPDNSDNLTNARSGSNGISPSLIALAVVTVLAVIFFLQNSELTRIDLWVFEWTTTVRWSLLVAMFIGVLLDRLFGIWWRRRGRRRDESKNG